MDCSLKIFCVDADETQARLVREIGRADAESPQRATGSGEVRKRPDEVFVLLIRASWSERG
jgi:hypothetical protein